MAKDEKDQTLDGPKLAAQILSRMSAENRNRIIGQIHQEEPQVAAKIEANLITFDEIASLTAQGVQALIKELPQEDLVLSLKAASDPVKETLLNNMTERKREMVTEELNLMPPTKRSDVEAAQRRILEKLEELRTAGKIRTQSKNDVWV